MEGYLTTQQAAEKLGVTPRRVLAMISAGRLPAIKVGEGFRATYYIAPDALHLVKNRKAGRPKGSKNKKRKDG